MTNHPYTVFRLWVFMNEHCNILTAEPRRITPCFSNKLRYRAINLPMVFYVTCSFFVMLVFGFPLCIHCRGPRCSPESLWATYHVITWILSHSVTRKLYTVTTTTTTPRPESASELYRPSDRRLTAKLVPTFADRWYHVVSLTDPYGLIFRFIDRNHYFASK
jgi:hypothetical protein